MTAASHEELLSPLRVGRLGAALYILSGIVTLASPLLPAPRSMNQAGVFAVGAAAMAIGFIFLRLPWGRWPRWVSLWLAGIPAQALIGLHNYFGGSDPYRYGLFFMVTYAWVGLAQPRWSSLKLAPFTVAAYLAPLLISDRPPWAMWSAVYALPVFILVGETTAWVADQLRQASGALTHQAFHDPLTGLANRLQLQTRADAALARARRHDRAVSLLFLDLDRFKAVNDSLGHEIGDELLGEVADRLRAAIRIEDTICRLGGDEFAVLLEEIDGAWDAEMVARRLVATLNEPFTIRGNELNIGVSIGIAIARNGHADLETLVRNSDLAMYLAKESGGETFRFYESGMSEEVQARIQLEIELRRGLEEGQVVPWFQPIVAIDTHRIVSVEALVRWDHPERGLISPAEFLPIAEETGLIVRLGRLVRRAACREARAWQLMMGDDAPTITVNMAARELEEPGFVEAVRADLQATGLTPSSLILEITETALVESGVGARVLDALRELGVGVALDDFGTGYSSMAYLKRLPVTILKLDRAFVRDLGRDAVDVAIARAVVELANALGLSVTAEGVEEPEQVAVLAGLGFQHAQGFLFARPMPGSDLLPVLLAGVASREPTPAPS